jgi:uroporphyrin-III C-methyltransferase
MMATVLGKVSIVGAGPGDPDLLTLKGRRCLEQADAVLYDQLINRALINYAPPGAELVYVGKQAGRHCFDQGEIQKLLTRRAREGKKVVRLKGGDPFVFGRGGEEAEVLNRAGIPYEIVPGVSSAIAVPACAGISLTHRAHASSAAIVTGHSSPAGKNTVNWQALASAVDTLVILMGVQKLGEIMQRLLDGGCEAERPVAIIESGTLPSQRSITGTVGTITKLAANSQTQPPAVIVIGEVVRFAEQLNWREMLRLQGRAPTVDCEIHSTEPLDQHSS